MSTPKQPTYEELLAENALMKQQLAALADAQQIKLSPVLDRTTPDYTTPTHQYLLPHPTRFTPYHHLSPEALQRFSRHLILKSVGATTQQSWLKSRVLIIGAGGLGSPVALYLAAAGVGHITLVDADDVDESNLHRQVIHSEATLNTPKVFSAAAQCAKINSSLTITCLTTQFTADNAIELADDHDIIVDCTDNVTARYLSSDAAVLTNTPLISAAAVSTNGQLTTYCYNNGPCYRCVNPNPPPSGVVQSCSDAGVIGTLVGVVGTMQALEALKVLANIPLLADNRDIFLTKQTEDARQETLIPNDTQHLKSLRHHSWPAKLRNDFTPLSETMLFWDGCSGDVRKAKLRPRQPECMCKTRPARHTGRGLPQDELHQAKARLNIVDWSCSVQPTPAPLPTTTPQDATLTTEDETHKPIHAHKPPEGSVDVDHGPLEGKFRLDRLNSEIMLSQTSTNHQTNALHPEIQRTIGRITSPLLVDVRAVEQFEICNMPYSVYCDVGEVMKNPNVLRNLLWGEYAKLYPTHVTPNPAYDSYLLDVEADDVIAKDNKETALQKKKRYQNYNYPPKYLLTADTTLAIIPIAQQEQEYAENVGLKEQTVVLKLLDITGRLNEHTDIDSEAQKHRHIDGCLLELPVLHASLLCRRGRWTYMLLEWLAKYIFGKYCEDVLPNDTMINPLLTIPTLSAQFAYMAVKIGFPPIVLSDIFGGLTAFHQHMPDFPLY